jgi:hypothetical protein
MTNETITRCDGCGKTVEDEYPFGWIHFPFSEDFPAEVIRDKTDSGYESDQIVTHPLHFCRVSCIDKWAKATIAGVAP